jgi:hypothetical protein
MVHPRLWHGRDPRRRAACPRNDIGIGGGRLVGLVGLVDDYGVLRKRDLLVRRGLWLNSNDPISLLDRNLVSRGSVGVCLLLGLGGIILLTTHRIEGLLVAVGTEDHRRGAVVVYKRRDGCWGSAAFVDFFTVTRIGGAWKITNKTFAHSGGEIPKEVLND